MTANTSTPLSSPPADGPRAWGNRLAGIATCLTPHSLLALINRVALAGIFWLSARTKVEGWFTISDSAYALFRDEYRLPLIPPHLAAQLATVAEHLFAVLLVLGLCTRLSALALLGMTLVIQVFVYPDAWPTHLSWAGLMLYLVGRGGGAVSLDRALGLR
ncbi:DoxX family protein [Acidovorax sp. sic0104]|uniref:DoxX family protein n=1 Tax=Acidovorax sp. sic0104 TaxID=2854784 RepID=UPI001C43E18C|nr:DoxX family protein [Acidovorax sp. sic0104]MBV7542243.1 DoxX family protein [Acidovorax sp. sic0104]